MQIPALKYYFLCFFFLFFSKELLSQDSITSITTTKSIQDINLAEEELQQAEELYEQAKVAWRKKEKNQAIISTELAISILEKYPEEKRLTYKKCLNNLGIFYYRTKNYYKALKVYKKLIKISEENDARGAKAFRRMAHIYNDLGDYNRAIQNYDKSALVFKALGDTEEFVINQLAIARVGIGSKDPEYMELIQKSMFICDSLKGSLPEEGRNIGLIDLNYGMYYDLVRKHDSAIDHYRRFLNHSIKTSRKADEFHALNNLGVSFKNKNEDSTAKEYFDRALILAMDDPVNRATVFDNQGDLFLKNGEYNRALDNYQKAITELLLIEDIPFNELPSFNNFQISIYKVHIVDYLIDKANAWIRYYEVEQDKAYLENALETFNLADQLVDVIYFESREDLSKLFWREKGRSLYINAVSVCHQLKRYDKAFYFMEKNKAILLLENITNINAKHASNLPEEVLQKELELIKRITNIEQDISNIKIDEITKKDSLKNIAFNDKEAYREFVDSLESTFPEYHHLKKNIELVTLSEVQKEQTEDDLIFQYIIGNDKGFVQMVSKSNVQLYEIRDVKSLIYLIESYKEQSARPFISLEDKEKYKETATNLYQELFPFENVKNLLTGKKITIIPDNILQYISFDALLVPFVTGDIEDQYFLNFCDIYYQHSISLKKQTTHIKGAYKDDFVSFFSFEFEAPELSSLKMNEKEIEKLDDLFSGQKYHGGQANKNNFFEAYGSYKIFHISSHGGVEANIPWLAFNNEIVTLDELYFLNNQSDLVVLSACKTSEGLLKHGEGVMSIARGFSNAGTKSVISSLWAIDERSGNEIIQYFYEYLKSGETKSKALNMAKRKYLQENRNTSESSPYYWSSLILTGDASSIFPPDTNYKYYLAGILALVLLLLFGKRFAKGVFRM